MERLRRYGRKKCGLELMRYSWLHLICVLMVGEMSETLNTDVLMVHYGDLELWVDKAQEY